MASLNDNVKRLRRTGKQLLLLADRLQAEEAEREDFDRLIAEVVGAQRDHFGRRPRARRGQGAKYLILDHLQRNLGKPVYGEELAVISGIQEWPRRLRELRVQDGYDLAEVGTGAYQLERGDQNTERARRWRVANKIRRSPGSGRDRVGWFLEANVEEIVSRAQLDYVSGIAEGSRRVRELRDEYG